MNKKTKQSPTLLKNIIIGAFIAALVAFTGYFLTLFV